VDANTVGVIAELTGISVRALHHYDHIGLVVPSVRTAAGYRGYTDTDVERLHLVLVYRAVGLPLDEIRALLDDPDVDVSAHLRRQHRLLLDQADRLAHTIKAVEELMNAHSNGIQLTAQEQVEIFGTDAFGGEYAEEAERRWGDTDAWKQAQQRAAQMTKQDWIDVKAEGDALLAALAQAKRDGVQPGSPAARTWWRGTARRSNASTTVAATCTATWSRCTWPTSDSPSTTTTSNPGSLRSSVPS
jgi:DNA-binding transcriptional MerR regulator